MLAYGIEIAISVVYVFVTRSRIKWLLPLAWGRYFLIKNIHYIDMNIITIVPLFVLSSAHANL
jgi:hypothetical protein